MQKLSKQGLLCGDKIHELELSENNIFGKAHWSKFTKGLHTSKQVMVSLLGCISVKGMQKLNKQGLFCGDKIHELELSENDIFGRAHWSKFTKGLHTSKQVLDYVHAGFLGPCSGPLF